MAYFPLWLAGFSLGLAWSVLYPLRVYLSRRRVIDIPNERSSHVRPTPRGGGIVIVVLTVACWSIYILSTSFSSWLLLLFYTLGSVLVAGISWLDDLRSLPNRIRLVTHTLSALVIMTAFGHLTSVALPVVGSISLGWLGLPITLLWIVGLINAYNFMDGIDGIAGSQAVVAGVGWAILAWLQDQPLIGALGLVVAATSLGFLAHNWPPARIFMGDVGSAFLGYTFAALAVISAQADIALVFSGILLLWPFIFDTTFTFLNRLRRGENVFAAHRSHLYQRLVIVGYNHQSVTLIYAGLAVSGLIFALFFSSGSIVAHWLVVTALPLCATGLWVFVTAQERQHHLNDAQRAPS